jgi:hypothetical protein
MVMVCPSALDRRINWQLRPLCVPGLHALLSPFHRLVLLF